MLINLSDYTKCKECGQVARIATVDGADVTTCKCGLTTFYFPDIDISVVTDVPDYMTIKEWKAATVKKLIEDKELAPSRLSYLRLAWENFRQFIRGKP